MKGLKPILLLLIFWLFVAWLFVIIATAIVDWSKSHERAYGIWKVCLTDHLQTCENYQVTSESQFKDCEGALIATKAFSVISIIWTFFPLALAIIFLLKPTTMKKMTLLLMLCLVGLDVLWTMLGWIMWLGVQARGQCVYADYDQHLGSSWFLQLFAFLFTLVAAVLAALLFLKWKKTPKYYNTPYGPAPVLVPTPYGPVPYFPPVGKVPPMYKDPYYGPAPYYPYPPPYPYAAYPSAPAYGAYPSPTGSPFVPSPYY